MRKGTGEKQHADGRTSTGERENTIQVRGKIQYSQEKSKTGKVVCDYRWLWCCLEVQPKKKAFGTSPGRETMHKVDC